MKKFFFVAIMLLASLAMSCKAQYVPQRADYTFKTQVFTTSDDEGDIVADSVVTTLTHKGGVETLVSYPLPLDPDQWHGIGEVREDDINFDSVPDLMICLGPTNRWGGFTYDGYVWDTKAHKFVHVDNFDQILDPEYDPKRGCIEGTLRIDNDFTVSTYQWQNGKLVLIHEESFTLDDE